VNVEALSGIWLVGSFLLGQGVALGGVVITSKGQTKREQAARDAERARSSVDRREAFELQHLMDVHGALSAVLSIAELHFSLQGAWLLQGHEPPAEDVRAEWEADREAMEQRGIEVGRQVGEHIERLKSLFELLLVDQLRLKVGDAVSGFERVEFIALEEGPQSASEALPGTLVLMRDARSMVASRIRQVYSSPERGAVTAVHR
jgi:hypothetical protein